MDLDAKEITLILLMLSISMLFYVVYKQIQLRLNRVDTFKKLKTEPQEFWVQLLNAYFVGTNYVVVSVV